MGDSSVEERVVNASLRTVPEAMRATVEALFELFAVFAEDAVVPDTVIDVVAPLLRSTTDEKKRGGAQQRRQVRQAVQQLLKANIMAGSLEGGGVLGEGDWAGAKTMAEAGARAR